MSEYRRLAYEFYKRNHICTQCRKRKTDGTRVTCDRCHSLNKMRNQKKREEKTKKEKPMRPLNTCYKCGEKVSSMNSLCDKCYGEVVIPEYLRRE